MTEMHELIAYLDYSFERAFKVKENGYIGAYRVSLLILSLIFSIATHSKSFRGFKEVRAPEFAGRATKAENRKAKGLLTPPC